MGTQSTVPCAAIFYVIKDETFLDQFPTTLPFYKRYIDDVFGIWVPHDNKYADSNLLSSLQIMINEHHGVKKIS